MVKHKKSQSECNAASAFGSFQKDVAGFGRDLFRSRHGLTQWRVKHPEPAGQLDRADARLAYRPETQQATRSDRREGNSGRLRLLTEFKLFLPWVLGNDPLRIRYLFVLSDSTPMSCHKQYLENPVDNTEYSRYAVLHD